MTLRRAAITTVIALGLMLGATVPALAQSMPCGTGATAECTAAKVGPFMQGVSVGCGNLGDCSLVDIKQVMVNIGNWILGIVGSLVLLFYIWGGIQFLTSGGDSGRIKSGKDSIKKATLGLVIVFVAGIAIFSLKETLLTGSVGGTGGAPITCTGAGTAGQTCGVRKVCNNAGQCVEACLVKYPDNSRMCIPKSQAVNINAAAKCEPDLCIDPNKDIQCCEF